MSANTGVLGRILQIEAARETGAGHGAAVDGFGGEPDSAEFADEQIRGLVRRVFVPGWPRPARQVVFCSAEKEVNASALCWKTAEVLANEGAGRIALVEASFDSREVEQRFGGTSNDGSARFEATGAGRMSSRQMHGVSLVAASTFLKTRENAYNAAWLRSRLGELRREFDYAVFHAGPVGEADSAALLAHLCDGLVLAIAAHRTRRLTALRIRDNLVGANVRLLGVVLQDRTFPIPIRLYRNI